MLTTQPKIFSKRISNFCKINDLETLNLLNNKIENTGPTLIQNKFRKIIAIFQPLAQVLPHSFISFTKVILIKFMNILKKFGSKEDLKFSRNSTLFISKRFETSNSKLARITNLDLKKYGYYLDFKNKI